MKRFIAFHAGTNSGIKSKEDAIKWATDILAKGQGSVIHLAEVIETVERSAPPIEVKPFFVQLNDEQPKAA